MRFQFNRSPRLFILLVCGSTLIGLYQFQHDLWHNYAIRNHSLTEQFIAKYEPLRTLLPTDEVTRFLVDESHVDANLMHPDGRFFLTQFAVSPRRVARCTTSRWVIIDSDHSEIVPEIATSSRWTLIADLNNGIRLYRTDKEE